MWVCREGLVSEWDSFASLRSGPDGLLRPLLRLAVWRMGGGWTSAEEPRAIAPHSAAPAHRPTGGTAPCRATAPIAHATPQFHQCRAAAVKHEVGWLATCRRPPATMGRCAARPPAASSRSFLPSAQRRPPGAVCLWVFTPSIHPVPSAAVLIHRLAKSINPPSCSNFPLPSSLLPPPLSPLGPSSLSPSAPAAVKPM